jgi:hypothetical protein
MGLRGGAVVIMVASFEAFLRSLFEEKLSVLVEDPPRVEFGKLPSKMQETSVFGTLERAMKGSLHEESGPRIDRLPEIYVAVRNVVSERVNPAAFTDTAGNPNAKRVKWMFKSIGVYDVFSVSRSRFDTAWGKAEIANFPAIKLDEIVGRRHVMAHSADALSLTRTDLQDYLKFLRTLALVLDQHLDDYVAGLCRGPL